MLYCEVCGKEIDQSEFTNKNLCSSECFHIDFWEHKILIFESLCEDRIIGDKRIAIIAGDHYTILPDADKGFFGFKGHSGRQMKIQLLYNDEIIETKNLWCQGTIPEHLRDRLFDTAKFIN